VRIGILTPLCLNFCHFRDRKKTVRFLPRIGTNEPNIYFWISATAEMTYVISLLNPSSM